MTDVEHKEAVTTTVTTDATTTTTTTVTTVQQTTTTTKVETPVGDKDFNFTFADSTGATAINAAAGDTITVNANVNAGSNTCAGMDVQFDTGALEITKIGAKSAACANAKVSSNPADKRANFTSTDTDGEPVAVTSGAAAFAFQVQIPSDAANGTVYKIGFADGECKVFKEGGTGDKYTTSFAPLVITVGEEDTTTSTTTTVTTTTTTVTTTTVTSTSVVTTTTKEGITIEAECIGKVYSEEDCDKNEWTVYGEPDTTFVVTRPDTVRLTCASIVNRIPDVLQSDPGFVPTSRMGELKYQKATK